MDLISQPPHPPFGHLLPQGEKGTRWSADLDATLLPSWEKVDRAQRETDEGVFE